VRANFAAIDLDRAKAARKASRAMNALSATLQGDDWRRYGALDDASAWPASNFARGGLAEHHNPDAPH